MDDRLIVVGLDGSGKVITHPAEYEESADVVEDESYQPLDEFYRALGDGDAEHSLLPLLTEGLELTDDRLAPPDDNSTAATAVQVPLGWRVVSLD